MKLFESTASAIMGATLFVFVFALGVVLVLWGSICISPTRLPGTSGNILAFLETACHITDLFGAIVLLCVGGVMVLNMTLLCCFIFCTRCFTTKMVGPKKKPTLYDSINYSQEIHKE